MRSQTIFFPYFAKSCQERLLWQVTHFRMSDFSGIGLQVYRPIYIFIRESMDLFAISFLDNRSEPQPI